MDELELSERFSAPLMLKLGGDVGIELPLEIVEEILRGSCEGGVCDVRRLPGYGVLVY